MVGVLYLSDGRTVSGLTTAAAVTLVTDHKPSSPHPDQSVFHNHGEGPCHGTSGSGSGSGSAFIISRVFAVHLQLLAMTWQE